MLLFPIIGLLFLSVLLGITFLLYYIPKQYGHQKTGFVLSSISLLIIGYSIVTMVFEDELFTKSDAQRILSEQGIDLKENFELTHNEFQSAIGDYYHTFSLEISENDKQMLIDKIRNSDGYSPLGVPQNQRKPMTKDGLEITIQNYELESGYVRELLDTQGSGYTRVTVSVSKEDHFLTYDYVDE